MKHIINLTELRNDLVNPNSFCDFGECLNISEFINIQEVKKYIREYIINIETSVFVSEIPNDKINDVASICMHMFASYLTMSDEKDLDEHAMLVLDVILHVVDQLISCNRFTRIDLDKL